MPRQRIEEAVRSRWRGQPGFFEIWFVVLLQPDAGRAWWLRYTTFAPATGQAGAPRATLWAAAFADGAPAVVAKRLGPLAGPRRADFSDVQLLGGKLDQAGAHGRVITGQHRIEWMLGWSPPRALPHRSPRVLERLDLPTHVAHVGSELACSGWIAVDGQRHEIRNAPLVMKHIWGTRRVEELFWLWCPRFAADPSAALEVTAARVRRQLRGNRETPWLTPIFARTRHGTLDRCGLVSAFRNRVRRTGSTEISFDAVSARRWVRGRAWCDPRTLAGYVYRDPSGWDVHVAQSDVASCTLELLARPHPLAAWAPVERLEAPHGAGLEFHAPEPMPGVRYLGWDEVDAGK